MSYSYEEIRAAAIDILAGRESTKYAPTQYSHLQSGIAEVLERRNPSEPTGRSYLGRDQRLGGNDSLLFQEVFWDLFRQGITTIGLNDANQNFPFFRLTSVGKRILENQQTYFFHDVSTYETLVKETVPTIDDVTLLYLKESMQAFRVGCMLSSSVMLGVATEHSFNLMLESVSNGPHGSKFSAATKPWQILTRVNKFKAALDKEALPRQLKEDLETHFAGILSIIRNFRNESGHPSGKIIGREQCYVLLNLFPPYCRKIYELKNHFS